MKNNMSWMRAASVSLALSLAAVCGFTAQAAEDPLKPAGSFTVVDGFYQNAATYGAATEFYITSLDGLKYFRDLVNCYDAAFQTYANGGFWTGEKRKFYGYGKESLPFKNKTIKLLADIDLGNEEWDPIGNEKKVDGTARVTATDGTDFYFYGMFDGQNHVVSNLKINNTSLADKDGAGFFGRFTTLSSVKNLTISNVNIYAKNYVGALCGNAGSGSGAIVIENVHIAGDVSVNGNGYVGGLLGHGQYAVTNCSVIANGGTGAAGKVISRYWQLGGIAGTGRAPTSVYGCRVENIDLEVYYYEAGGILGRSFGNVVNCVVTNVTIGAYSGSASFDATKCGLIVGNEYAAGGLVIGNEPKQAGQKGSANDTAVVGWDVVGTLTAGGVTGGTFEALPDSYLAPNCVKTAQGTTPETWIVQAPTPVCELVCGSTVTKYETIEAAVAAFNNMAAGDYVLEIIKAGTYTLTNCEIVQDPNAVRTLVVKPATGIDVTLAGTSGSIFTVNGKSSVFTDTAVTFEGLAFDLSTGVNAISAIAGEEKRYAHNLTVTNCTFSSSTAGKGYIFAAPSGSCPRRFLVVDCTCDKINQVGSGYFYGNPLDTVNPGIDIANTTFTGCKAILNNQGAGSWSRVRGVTANCYNPLLIQISGGNVAAKLDVFDSSLTSTASTDNDKNKVGMITARYSDCVVNVSNTTFTAANCATLTDVWAMDRGNGSAGGYGPSKNSTSVKVTVNKLDNGVSKVLDGKTATTDASKCSGGDLANAAGYGEGVKIADMLVVAQIGDVKYKTLAAALAAVKEGETIQLLAGTIEEGTLTLPDTIKNVTIQGAADHASIIKNSEISHRTNGKNIDGLTIDGVVFENSRVLFVDWGAGTVKNITLTNNIFSNLNDTTNVAALHLNLNAQSAVDGLTFVGNVIENCLGGSKSGIYGAVKGNTTIQNNVIRNVAFRPICIQIIDTDGVNDNTIVTGNTFAGTAGGRLQIYGTENETTCVPEGTDGGSFIVNNNIFKDITAAQQICCWGINTNLVTADITGNYYDAADPKMFWNNFNNVSSFYISNTEWSAKLPHANGDCFNYYTELNDDGTIKASSKVEVRSYVAQIGSVGYMTLAGALEAVQNGETITLLQATEEAVNVTRPASADFTIDLGANTLGNVTVGFDNGSVTSDALNLTGNGGKTASVYVGQDTAEWTDRIYQLNLTNSVTIGDSVYVRQNGQLNLSGATVTADYNCIYGEVNVLNGSTYTVKGANFYVSGRVSSDKMAKDKAIITVDGSTLDFTKTYALEMSNGLDSNPYAGSGALILQNGATANGSNIWLGDNADGSLGTIAVESTDSTLTLSGYLRIGEGDYVSLKNSLVTLKSITNNGEIYIDATGLEAPTKVIDYTGTGTMTLADYGKVTVLGDGVVYVENNDLFVAAVVDTGDGKKAIVVTEEQTSVVDKTEIPQSMPKDVVDQIVQKTSVEGVKLAPETLADISGTQAVVNKAKAEGGAQFAKNLEKGTNITIKVIVDVKPTEYVAPSAPTEEVKGGVVKFDLTPVATVVVDEGGAGKETLVEVTNEMIDQLQDIEVTVYTGFCPILAVHADENDKTIETFSGDAISYDEATGKATVIIHHFSTTAFYQDAFVAKVGTGTYKTLEEAFTAATDGQTISLVSSTTLATEIDIDDGRNLTLDLGGNTITLNDGNFGILNGALNVVGEGEITGTGKGYKAIYLKGSSDPEASHYSDLTIGEDVTVCCDNGYCVMISANADSKAFGVNITVDGTVKGYYGALYTNGSFQDAEGNVPVITVNGVLVATDVDENESAAVYAAGYAEWNFNAGCAVTGGTAVYAKGGDITINGGLFTGRGDAKAFEHVESGYMATGDALVFEKCTGYANLKVRVVDGAFVGVKDAKATATYTYGEGQTAITKYVEGGTFNTAIAKADCADWFSPVQNEDGTYGVKAEIVFIDNVLGIVRKPWNGLVDLTFSLRSKSDVRVFVGAYDINTNRLSMTAATLKTASGDQSVNCSQGFEAESTDGAWRSYHLVWDSVEVTSNKLNGVSFKIFAK